MYSRKAETILTSRIANSKKADKIIRKAIITKEPELTSPADKNSNTAYVNLGGVMFAVK